MLTIIDIRRRYSADLIFNNRRYLLRFNIIREPKTFTNTALEKENVGTVFG